MEKTSKSAGDILMKYLPLIGIIISFIFAYATLQNRVNANEVAIIEIRAELNETQKTISGFSNDITYIKTTLDFIKNEISDSNKK